MSPPFLGAREEGHGHLGLRVHDLVHLSLRFLVDLILIFSVCRETSDVVHGGEVVVALPLGTQADLVPVVLDLRLVPQGHLDLWRKRRTVISPQPSHPNPNLSILDRFSQTSHLSVNLIGVGQFVIDGGAVQRWEGHGLHGDQLDLAGESPARVRAARHPVDVFEDGGRGQLLVGAVDRRRT